MKSQKIIAIGAHHDDIEIGCGGALAKLIIQEHNVKVATLTTSAVNFKPKGIRRTYRQAHTEYYRSTHQLGLVRRNVFELHRAPNGCLQYSVGLMRKLEQFMRDADILFCHWQGDMNTDHAEAAKLCITAGRHVKTILQFRSNWYQPERAFHGVTYFDTSGKPHRKKEQALYEYQSEIRNRGYAWIDSFLQRDACNGVAIGVKHAEVFEPVRHCF